MTAANSSAWAVIDLGALVHNLRVLAPDHPRRSVIAVVKADAYGHGALEVARALARENVAMFAVATVAEGQALRAGGIKTPILLLGAFPRQDIDDILAADLTPSISSVEFAGELSRAAERKRRRVPVHVKIDTGMGRLGLGAQTAVAAIERMSLMPGLALEGLYTHFASADEDREFTLRQAAEYGRLVSLLAGVGVTVKYHHAAASAAVLDMPETLFDAVRPGLALYGLRPAPGCGKKADLRPVMELCARVVHVDRRPAGATIGYGRAYRCERESTVAVVSAGYADGYDRRLSGQAVVTINGKDCAQLGRVSMDMISVDVTHAGEVHPGDTAVLFSADPPRPNSVEGLAALIGTIPYCLVCGVSARVQRVYRR